MAPVHSVAISHKIVAFTQDPSTPPSSSSEESALPSGVIIPPAGTTPPPLPSSTPPPDFLPISGGSELASSASQPSAEDAMPPVSEDSGFDEFIESDLPGAGASSSQATSQPLSTPGVSAGGAVDIPAGTPGSTLLLPVPTPSQTPPSAPAALSLQPLFPGSTSGEVSVALQWLPSCTWFFVGRVHLYLLQAHCSMLRSMPLSFRLYLHAVNMGKCILYQVMREWVCISKIC